MLKGVGGTNSTDNGEERRLIATTLLKHKLLTLSSMDDRYDPVYQL